MISLAPLARGGPTRPGRPLIRSDRWTFRSNRQPAIVEKLDGKSADWMEKVGDEQYPGG